MKTVISTPNAPGAIGPYSQGYAFGDLVITSGQIPVDPATGAIPEGIAAQAEQSCKNVGAILEAAGVTLESVTSPPSTRCTPSISPPSPPAAAWPCESCPRACSARSRPSPSSKSDFQQREPVPRGAGSSV